MLMSLHPGRLHFSRRKNGQIKSLVWTAQLHSSKSVDVAHAPVTPNHVGRSQAQRALCSDYKSNNSEIPSRYVSVVLPIMSLHRCQIRKRAMHVPHIRRLNVAQLEDVRAQCRRFDAVGA